MATSPCRAWNTPVMIIMIAANMMNPTAQPLVCRPAREYASLLTADPSSASDDRPHHGTAADADITPFGMSCAGGSSARPWAADGRPPGAVPTSEDPEVKGCADTEGPRRAQMRYRDSCELMERAANFRKRSSSGGACLDWRFCTVLHPSGRW